MAAASKVPLYSSMASAEGSEVFVPNDAGASPIRDMDMDMDMDMGQRRSRASAGLGMREPLGLGSMV